MEKGWAWSLDNVDVPRLNLNPRISLDFKFFDLKLNFKFEVGVWLRHDCLSSSVRAHPGPMRGLSFRLDERPSSGLPYAPQLGRIRPSPGDSSSDLASGLRFHRRGKIKSSLRSN